MESTPAAMPTEELLAAVQRAAIAGQEQTWRLREPGVGGGLLGRLRQAVIWYLVRPYIVPLIEQQQAYNAAVLRTIYTLTEAADQRQRRVNEQLKQLSEQAEALGARVARLEPRIDSLELRLDPLEPRIDSLELRVDPLEPRVDQLEIYRQAIDPFIHSLDRNGRAVQQQLQAFADQLAGLEDTDTQLLGLLQPAEDRAATDGAQV